MTIMCKQVTGTTAGREPRFNRQTDNQNFCKLKCCTSYTYCTRAFTKERISPGSTGCYHQRKYKLKYVKGVSCVTPLSCVKAVTNVKNAVSNLPVGSRLHNYWQTWLNLGAGPKVVQILREGYTLPFRIQPKLTRSPTVISCCVNPHRNLYLLEALHQLIDKSAVELVQNKKSLYFFQLSFSSTQTQQQVESLHWRPILDLSKLNLFHWRPILDLSKLNLFLKAEKFKMETPETVRTSLQQGEWVSSTDFRDAYFHIPIQEQSKKYLRFHVKGRTYQFKARQLDLSTAPMEFTVIAKEVKLCHTQGYENLPVPRRLVGESQIPPGLSPAYTGSSENVSRIRLAGELRKIGTGSQAGYQLCRLPVRPQV